MKYNYHQEIATLEKFYQQAIESVRNQSCTEFGEEIRNSVDIFLQKIETDKSLIQVIITKEFINTYTEELVTDARNSTEVKDAHIQAWKMILQKYI